MRGGRVVGMGALSRDRLSPHRQQFDAFDVKDCHLFGRARVWT
jgi:hypothetical protein